MADFIPDECTAIHAQDAQGLRPTQTISSDAKESQSLFEREMALTCRDEDFGFAADLPGMMRFAEAVKRDRRQDDRPGRHDRSDMSGTARDGSSGGAVPNVNTVRAGFAARPPMKEYPHG